MTANVIAEELSSVESQTEQAWREYSLERNPAFQKIVEELRDPMGNRVRKALTRGYPRYAFAA